MAYSCCDVTKTCFIKLKINPSQRKVHYLGDIISPSEKDINRLLYSVFEIL